jgi:ketosteroid isomerase-like protein
MRDTQWVTPRELITDYLAAARAGDWDNAYGYFADGIVFRIPGRSRFAGERRGKEAAVEYIESFRAHYGEGEIEVELVDMLASDDRVALLVRERFLGEETIEIRRANVYRVQDDAIVEITIFEGDQYTVDALMEKLDG